MRLLQLIAAIPASLVAPASSLLVLQSTPASTHEVPNEPSLSTLVDAFVGTGGHGHTFPGATTPWGMVQATPWCHSRDTWDSQSGFSLAGGVMKFYGMAHTALSGAGSGEMGELRLSPRPSKTLHLSPESTQASPGYFATRIYSEGENEGIDIKSSATPRGAVHEFTFPLGERALALHLEPPPEAFFGNELKDFWVEEVSDRSVEGCTLNLLMGWGAPVSILCFMVDFSLPFTSSLHGGRANRAEGGELQSSTVRFDFPKVLDSNTSELLARVGVSRTNILHARANFAAEVAGKSFDEVRLAARRLWDKQLGAVQVSISNRDRARAFYSALYHTMMAPNLVSDVDGSYRIERLPPDRESAPEKGDPYRWWGSSHGSRLVDLDDTMPIRQARSGVQYGTFSLWDTYRSLHPLYNLFFPEQASYFAESLLTFAEEWKMLPRSEVFSSTSDLMAGDGGGIILATSALLGLVDKHRALRILNVTRRRLADDAEYSSTDDEGNPSISRALEQGMADSCVSRLALNSAWNRDAQFFLKRAESVRRHWKPKWHLYADRLPDEALVQDWEGHQSAGYQEGSPLQYSWAAQFDLEWQVRARGGRDRFACELDDFFTTAPVPHGPVDMSGNIHGASLGNEPCMHTPYLFSLVGYPALTQKVVDQAVKKLFSGSPSGLPGNDDMGELSSWLVFSVLGFYPADPCSGQFALGRPFIEKARLAVNGGILEIRVHNQGEEQKYVERATMNGKRLQKPVLSSSDLMEGGSLEFWMTSQPPVRGPTC